MEKLKESHCVIEADYFSAKPISQWQCGAISLKEGLIFRGWKMPQIKVQLQGLRQVLRCNFPPKIEHWTKFNLFQSPAMECKPGSKVRYFTTQLGQTGWKLHFWLEQGKSYPHPLPSFLHFDSCYIMLKIHVQTAMSAIMHRFQILWRKRERNLKTMWKCLVNTGSIERWDKSLCWISTTNKNQQTAQTPYRWRWRTGNIQYQQILLSGLQLKGKNPQREKSFTDCHLDTQACAHLGQFQHLKLGPKSQVALSCLQPSLETFPTLSGDKIAFK